MSKKMSRLAEALLETAQDMHQGNLMSQETYDKITLRHLGAKGLPQTTPLTGDEIRHLREREHLSQAVLAKYLGLTAGYISQLERGTKHPTGPALVLLNVIQRKGIEAIL